MISEPQAIRLLTEIEEATGRPLTSLRKDLLRNRIPESAIWELVVLYVSFKAFGDVVHEPGEALPDVLVLDMGVSMEAHVVFSKSEGVSRNLRDFDTWIHRQIVKSGIKIESRNTVTELIDADKDTDLPDKKYWSQLRRRASWRVFLKSLKATGRGVWKLDDYNLSVAIELTRSAYSTGHSFVPRVSEKVSENPIYTAIRRKSRQVRKWEDQVLQDPVVLVIGAFEPGAEFEDGSYGGRGDRDKIIWSSILDPSDLGPLQAHNLMGAEMKITKDGLLPTGKSYRVPGSENISAIIFVQFRTTLERNSVNKEAHAKIYINPRAKKPLHDGQLEALERMDFSVVEYGPGWESWQGATRDSKLERNLKRAGGWSFQGADGGGVVLEIPAVALTQVLSGLRSSEQVFGGGVDGPNPQSIIARTLEENRELIGVQLIEPGSQREERRVRLEFGPPTEALISRAKEK